MNTLTLALEILLVSLPGIIFPACVFFYDRWYYWRRTFQGKAFMGILAAMSLIFFVDALVGILRTVGVDIDRTVASIVSTVIWATVSGSGIYLLYSLKKTRDTDLLEPSTKERTIDSDREHR